MDTEGSMTDIELDELETKASVATAGPWDYEGCVIFMEEPDFWPILADCKKEEDAAFIAVANPATILVLINQLRACHKLIKIMSEAARRTESIAFAHSYFDKDAYSELCKDIPKLRKEAGLEEDADND